jgi:glycosyltransferase involved in cell wall biosynthesis
LFLFQNISVIIPVYNAATFVTKAVESALIQTEVAEVLLIEDSSKDNSLEICRHLSEKYEKVKVLTHPDNENKGAGESRNLGIKAARSDFIAFLDADDFYLPGRFEAEREIFKNANVDGVYGAMGFHYYSEEGKKKYQESGYSEMTTVSAKVPGNELFFSLVHIHNSVHGQFHLNSLTVKKSLFTGTTALFNDFKMHEDTAFLVQLSLNCRLEPGIIDRPVSMYGVHDSNRIIDNDPKTSGSRARYWKYLYNWSLNSGNGKKFSKLFQANWMKEKLLLSNKYTGPFQLLWCCMSNSIFLRKDMLFAPAAKHVLGKRTGPYILNYKQRIQMNLFKDHPYSSIMDEFIKKKCKIVMLCLP